MMISPSLAVLLTLSYESLFDFPLTTWEVWQRLVKAEASFPEVEKILNDLYARGIVERGFAKSVKRNTSQKRKEKAYWGVTKKNLEDLVAIRHLRWKKTQQKWAQAARVVEVLGWLPWVRGIAVTGSVAMNNAGYKSDLDLLIVTAPSRLWLTRILVAGLVSLQGKRRTWSGNQSQSWCFNLWLEEDQLELSPSRRQLYTAYESLQMKWVLDKDGLEKRFLQKNAWIRGFLPNFYQVREKEAQQQKLELSAWAQRFNPVFDFAWQLINLIAYSLQRLYMLPHQTREKVSLKKAFFHPRPTQVQLYQSWRDLLKDMPYPQQTKVLVTGVFDLLHSQHKKFLMKARAAGNYLIVGIESDERVRELKGPERPIEPQALRLKKVQSLSCVNQAFILPEKFSQEKEHMALLQKIQPAVLAVSQHTPNLEQKEKLMKKIGGEVRMVYQHHPEVSTTKIINHKN